MAPRDPRAPSVGLVLVRIALGLLILSHGVSALASGQPDGAALRASVEAALSGATALGALWGDVLLYNPDAIAFLWRWSSALLGLMLLLGAYTRAAGCTTAFLCWNAFAFGPGEQARLFLLAGACAIACTLSHAGRLAGADRLLERRSGRSFRA